MNKAAAHRILEEAGRDRRIAARLNTKFVAGEIGYRVDLVLRRLYTITVKNLAEWESVKEAWRDM